MILTALLAAALVHSPDPVAPASPPVTQEAVQSYYQAELYRGANPRVHAIKVVGQRMIQGGEATLVCASYTMKLRFAGDHTSTEALYFRGERVVKRASGNEGLQVCAVV